MEDSNREEGLTTSEMVKVVLERQIDAVTRLLSLLPDRKMTIHDVINVLAEAEDAAQYVCGFIDLSQYDDEKEIIAKAIVDKGLGSVDEGGQINLTSAGEVRAQTKLPEPIEQALKERH